MAAAGHPARRQAVLCERYMATSRACRGRCPVTTGLRLVRTPRARPCVCGLRRRLPRARHRLPALRAAAAARPRALRRMSVGPARLALCGGRATLRVSRRRRAASVQVPWRSHAGSRARRAVATAGSVALARGCRSRAAAAAPTSGTPARVQSGAGVGAGACRVCPTADARGVARALRRYARAGRAHGRGKTTQSRGRFRRDPRRCRSAHRARR